VQARRPDLFTLCSRSTGQCSLVDISRRPSSWRLSGSPYLARKFHVLCLRSFSPATMSSFFWSFFWPPFLSGFLDLQYYLRRPCVLPLHLRQSFYSLWTRIRPFPSHYRSCFSFSVFFFNFVSVQTASPVRFYLAVAFPLRTAPIHSLALPQDQSSLRSACPFA